MSGSILLRYLCKCDASCCASKLFPAFWHCPSDAFCVPTLTFTLDVERIIHPTIEAANKKRKRGITDFCPSASDDIAHYLSYLPHLQGSIGMFGIFFMFWRESPNNWSKLRRHTVQHSRIDNPPLNRVTIRWNTITSIALCVRPRRLYRTQYGIQFIAHRLLYQPVRYCIT